MQKARARQRITHLSPVNRMVCRGCNKEWADRKKQACAYCLPEYPQYKQMGSLSWLEQQASKLNMSTPRSELWFYRMVEKTIGWNVFDRLNMPFHGLIPDIINHRYKYIVEVDGSIHSSLRERDRWKDEQYSALGYRVIRIAYGSIVQAKLALAELKALRSA